MKNHFKKVLKFGPICCFIILTATSLLAQNVSSSRQILMDVGHGQVFYNDPDNMHPTAGQDLERVKYMTGELKKNAQALNAEVGFIRDEITAKSLADCDLLFIHTPSSRYSDQEVGAISSYVKGGGSLFIVMDGDYWTTLEKTNVNDLVAPYDLKYGGMSPDQSSGGTTRAGLITSRPLKISYHGSRQIDGGTPFCFNNQGEDYPFGTFLEIKNGGKIVAMGDGMTSLYMTRWDGVEGYQCSDFMNDVIKWLLE